MRSDRGGAGIGIGLLAEFGEGNFGGLADGFVAGACAHADEGAGGFVAPACAQGEGDGGDAMVLVAAGFFDEGEEAGLSFAQADAFDEIGADAGVGVFE
jgi:hypothetical protein